MNNIGDNKKSVLKNFFIIFFLFFFTILIVRNFGGGTKKEDSLTNDFYCIILHKHGSLKELEKLKDEDIKKNNKFLDFDIFQIGVDSSKYFNIKNVENINDQKFLEYKNKIINGEQYFFRIKPDSDPNLNSSQKLSYIRDFFNVKTGTDKNYILQRKFQDLQKNNKYFEICKKDKDNIIPLQFNDNKEWYIKNSSYTNEKLSSKDYNNLIKKKLDKDGSINFFYLQLKEISEPIKIFIDDSGDLPIQWSNKINWNFYFYWGYIWNVLIILIASVLSFFSSIFFGNLGWGIILTTLLIRTLLWPVYAKSNSFNMNMSLMQPEIDKIKEKYVLKRDRESLQKMQIEISKVYKKHNFNIFTIFTSFCQIPIFIAMFRTLSRFRVPGGIFDFKSFVQKPFLGFIYLDSSDIEYHDLGKLSVRIFLSCLIGISMFFLNKINSKKSIYLKQNDKLLSDEQKLKKKSQETTMKIVSYIMIFFMVITSFKDLLISLYWIVGNIYTICQTIINRKIMDKKYVLLKQKGF